jgi:hypothetical protein
MLRSHVLIGMMIFDLCVTIAASNAATAQKTSDFLAQVRDNFAKWDTDHDGVLSADEIEKAVDDPTVKGPAAAAAAALRRAIRANPDISPVTIETLTKALDEKTKPSPKIPSYNAMYDIALGKIIKTPRDLFVSGLPRVETLGQGRLGDCFLLAPLGTVAFKEPERLKKMVTPLSNGQIAVQFANGEKVTLPAPTDAEIAIGASTLDDGIWANVFEKSIGHIYLERQKTPRHVTPYSIIGVGGTPNSPLSILTGHKCIRVGCEDFQKDKLSKADRATRLDDMRKRLEDAFATRHLVVGGTGDIHGGQTIVPGLYYDHSYGVLNYDRKTDIVTFWNPMGNHYVPKGTPGLEHGYVTNHGRFDVPLTEAVMWFGSFSIETDEAVESK